MIFNVQLEVGETSASLLEWINIERYETGKQGSLFTFRQVVQQNSIYQILKNVDEIFFSFQNLQLHAKMDLLQKYLERQFGKRMKWGFKQSLGNFCQQSHIKEFTKLVCYFSIHSKKKNQVINRILTLSQETQKFLMEHMQKIQEKLQNIMQIKEILQQMQILECQNQEFKTALEQMAKTNTRLLQFVKDCQEENKRYKDQVQKLRSEKCEVFSTLKIDYITEYLDAFTKLKYENERYLEYLNQSELKVERIQEINKELNDRIKCDCLVINNLSQEITRLKEICNESLIKVDYDWQRSSASKNNTLKSIGRSNNKENISKCSTQGKSMEVPAEWLGLLQNEDQNHLQDKSFYKTHNHELMGKLENMYSKYNELNDEATLLRQKNKQLKLKNKQLKRVFKSVQYLQNQFQFKYRAADIEAKKAIKRLIRTNE